MLEDGLAGDAPGAYRVVRALHFGHVQEARRAADQTAARERELGNGLHVQSRHFERQELQHLIARVRSSRRLLADIAFDVRTLRRTNAREYRSTVDEQHLEAALVERARAVADALAADEELRDVRVVLEALELLVRTQVRVPARAGANMKLLGALAATQQSSRGQSRLPQSVALLYRVP